MTVLFADLAGSTALGSRIDPEELRVIQGELFELVNAEVERFGGISEKFVGDAVVAVFGVPLAHDDDAERAVRAALSVREKFPGFADGVRERHGAEVGLRIGVNTGEVVAGREAVARGELMVTGDAVNVAARLQQRAEPGQVLVGERTHTVTRRAVRYESAGAAPAKGKEAPVSAWEATAVIALPGERRIEGLSGEMIGREEEIVVLGALTTRVERERAPQLVTIYGHAGVGKSRLLTEFVARLPDAHVLVGRCLPYGEGVTYWPLGEAAKGYAEILDTDPIDAALAKLESAVAAHTGPERVAEVVEAIAWTIGLTLPQDEQRDIRDALCDSWRRFLSGLGATRITVLAVEDVHWASEPLLELLEQLTDSLAETAVLTICTARPEFLDARGTWGGGLRDSTSIKLSPLLESESMQLIEALVGHEGLPPQLTNRIVARAEGNPFFVEEILQMLIDREAITREDGGWTVRDHVAAAELPDSIHGVIAARIDLLDPASREALRHCSVMGRVFWPGAVGIDDETIAALTRRALVVEHPDSTVAGMREFSFKHALTQDVAYATLPKTERRNLHRRVGLWIEDVAPGRESEMAEVAAYHLASALSYGETAPEVRSRCAELSIVAGEAALARAAADSASRLLTQALQLVADPRQRIRALVGLGRANVLSVDSDRAHARFAEARDEAAAIGDRRLLADALSWLSRTSWLTERWDDALPEASAAVEALAGLEETPQLARALARLSQLEMLRGLPSAGTRAREAVAVALRVGDAHAELNARVNLLTADANRGVPLNVVEASEIVTRAIETGHTGEAYRCLVNSLWVGQGHMARDELESAVERLRTIIADVPAVEGLGTYFELSYAVLVDVPAARWARLDRLPPETEFRSAISGTFMLARELAGGMAMRRGDLTRAAPPLAELRRRASASGEPQRILPMACVVMPYAVVTGDRETVRKVAEEVFSTTDRQWMQLTTAPISRALASASERDLLERMVEALRSESGAAGSPRTRNDVAVAEGLLALGAGRADEAVEWLRDAAEAERRLGWTYRAACLEVDLGAALEAAGHGDDADAVRRGAAAVLEPLGCVHAY